MKNILFALFTVFFLIQEDIGDRVTICDSMKCVQDKAQRDYYNISTIIKFEDGLFLDMDKSIPGYFAYYDLTKRKASKLKMKRAWSVVVEEN